MIDSIILIPIFIEVLIAIGIIGGIVWIWRKRHWSILKKAAITITFAAVLLISFYASFAFILVSSDQANYLAKGSNLGQIDYDVIISNAQKAGYRVDVPTGADSIQEFGVHPSNIRELDERFGKEYRFWSAGYFYNEKVYFKTVKYQGSNDIEISFFKEDGTYSPFKPEDLPPDEWIIEKFRLMFGINDVESRNYLTHLKDSAGKGPETKISIGKEINVAALYSDLKVASSNSSISSTVGDGWFKETFYSEDKKIGFLDFIIPNTRIIFKDRGQEYIITIDRMGGVRPGLNSVQEKKSRKKNIVEFSKKCL